MASEQVALEPTVLESLKNMKRQGNLAFISSKIKEAIQSYSEVLKACPEDAEVLSNRAASFIRVKYYQKAKEDLHKVMKLEKESNIKTIVRMVNTLWGLQQYDECLEFLEEAIKRNEGKPQQKKISNLIVTSRDMKMQSQAGEYDMQELIKKQLQVYNCAEFVGPVKIEKVSGKGRGLVATEDIKRGQVVLGSKAFAIVFPDSVSPNLPFPSPKLKVNQFGKSYLEDPKHAKLVTVIEDIISSNPEAKQEFFKLYAGPKLMYVDKPNDNNKTQNPGENDGSLSEEELERINYICYYNGIHSATNSNPSQPPDPSEIDEIKNVNTFGVWLLPSYLNHSCVDINCDNQIYGDFLIIRAIKNIAKGEELLISYTTPTKLYLERKVHLENYGIQCNCRLCQIETKESKQIHTQRRELILSFLESCHISKTIGTASPKSIEDIKCRLEALHPENQDLNFALFWINRELGWRYLNILDFTRAAASFETSYYLSKFTCLAARQGLQLAIQIFLCYVNAHNKQALARYWMNIIMEESMTSYGTANVLTTVVEREGIPISPENIIRFMQEYSNHEL